jgi:organic radical activating enzyme
LHSPRPRQPDRAPDRGSAARAPLLEVFAAIQGEGVFVGEPQTFVRLAGCPLRCRWCDTPASWTTSHDARARTVAADGTQHDDAAWATPFEALCRAARAEPGTPRTLSVTGGEPLVWPEFVLGLGALKGSRRLHLETAGAHPETLARVLDVVDHVSLDVKPDFDLDAPVELDLGPGDATGDAPGPTPERAPRDAAAWSLARRRSLALVAGRDACAKLVVSGGHPPERFQPLLEELAETAPRLPLVLQPVTPQGGARRAGAALLGELVERARELELAVRVLPQVHRALRLR